jgi:hypothetical protein
VVAARTGALAANKVLAKKVLRRLLRNMHDSFCHGMGQQDASPVLQGLRGGGLGMNFGALLGAERSWG